MDSSDEYASQAEHGLQMAMQIAERTTETYWLYRAQVYALLAVAAATSEKK